MALELRQQLKLAQKLVMTPQLRQAIKLLQLGRLELTEAVRSELEQNPFLEEVAEGDAGDAMDGDAAGNAKPAEPKAEVVAKVVGDGPAGLGQVDWNDYANTFDTDFSFGREAPSEDAPSPFDFLAKEPGLEAHLQWQLSHEDLDDTQRTIAFAIIGNLDHHGFLVAEPEEIARQCQVEPAQVEEVLDLVRSLDPPGIAARNVQESLLLQLEAKGRKDSLAYRIVREHLHLLELKNVRQLAQQTGASTRQVEAAIAEIQELTPYPGNQYSAVQVNYVVPDVFIHKIDGEFVIELNEDGMPKLALSSEYKTLLKQKNALPQDSRSFLLEKKRSAQWFIKSIEQRNRTIYRVMECLLKFQREFFEKGPGHLRPLILKDVAEEIEMHESTVSRVTSNKYVQTPHGIFELKYFFTTGVSTMDGNLVAAENIKNRIRQLIQNEDPKKPLSDAKISELLAKENIKVARRTVAKYRDQMQILPVKYRRKR